MQHTQLSCEHFVHVYVLVFCHFNSVLSNHTVLFVSLSTFFVVDEKILVMKFHIKKKFAKSSYTFNLIFRKKNLHLFFFRFEKCSRFIDSFG